jgi:hypothetical protein
MLLHRQNPEIRAYFIWGPFLLADNEESARLATGRLLVPGAVYFWMPDVRLSADFAAALRLPMGRLAWDVYLLYRRGTMWDRTVPQPAYWQHQIDVLQGDKLNMAAMEIEIQRALQH